MRCPCNGFEFVWWTAHRRGNAHMAPAPAVRTSTTPRGMRETNPTFGQSTVWPMGDESLAARSATAAAASGGAQTARRAPTASRQPPHLESASTECCVVTGARPRGAGLLDRIARTLPPPSPSADAAGMAGAARRHHSLESAEWLTAHGAARDVSNLVSTAEAVGAVRGGQRSRKQGHSAAGRGGRRGRRRVYRVEYRSGGGAQRARRRARDIAESVARVAEHLGKRPHHGRAQCRSRGDGQARRRSCGARGERARACVSGGDARRGRPRTRRATRGDGAPLPQRRAAFNGNNLKQQLLLRNDGARGREPSEVPGERGYGDASGLRNTIVIDVVAPRLNSEQDGICVEEDAVAWASHASHGFERERRIMMVGLPPPTQPCADDPSHVGVCRHRPRARSHVTMPR